MISIAITIAIAIATHVHVEAAGTVTKKISITRATAPPSIGGGGYANDSKGGDNAYDFQDLMHLLNLVLVILRYRTVSSN
jgi:hypothetical protein